MHRIKKWLPYFISIFAAVFWWSAKDPLNAHFTYQAVSKNYAQTSATGYDIIPLSRENPPDRLKIWFEYQVNGEKYHTDTSITDPGGIAGYLAENPVPIVYAQDRPHLATLKRYYDMNAQSSSLWQILTVGAMLGAAVALPASLAFFPFFNLPDRPQPQPIPLYPFVWRVTILFVGFAVAASIILYLLGKSLHHGVSIAALWGAIFWAGSDTYEKYGSFFNTRQKSRIAGILLAIFVAVKFVQLVVRTVISGNYLPMPPWEFVAISQFILMLYAAIILLALDQVDWMGRRTHKRRN